MEKHLWILRHATAEPGGLAKDVDRQLSTKGLQEASSAGQWLSLNRITFDYVIASPACRATQTVEAVAQCLSYPPERIVFESSIYEADVKAITNVIVEIPDQVNHALLVGHNPGLESLVQLCCDDHRSQEAYLLPATLVHIVFPQNWNEVLGSFGKFVGIFHVAEY